MVLFHHQLQWTWDAMPMAGVLDRTGLGVNALVILFGLV